jgi:signal transduction histidine kinase
MNSDHPSTVLKMTARLAKPSVLLAGVQAATARVVALRQHGGKGASTSDVIQDALEELELAQEELRRAQEHLHAQADEISNAANALEGQRVYYRSLFYDAPEAYLITDQQGEVIDANRRANELFQIDLNQTPRTRLAQFLPWSEQARLRELLQARSAQPAALRCELEIVPWRSATPVLVHASIGRSNSGPEGAPVLHWVVRALALPTGEASASVPAESAVLRQCQAKLENERRARARAEATLRENQNLLSMVAHELRTPLSAIMGWAEILNSKRSDAVGTERIVNGLRQSAYLLARMLEDLVDDARAAQGLLKLELSKLSLPDLVEHVVEEQRGAAQLRNIRMTSILDRSLPPLNADPFRIEQVLSNLLESALKYTDLGGAVQVRLAQRGDCAELMVRDSSNNSAHEPLVSVFDAFVQVQRGVSSFEGLGLGLDFARRIVELHGGTFTMDQAGAGSSATFTVRLPLATESSRVTSERPC